MIIPLDGSLAPEPFSVCDFDFDAGQFERCDAGLSGFGGVFRFEPDDGVVVLGSTLPGWFDVTAGSLLSRVDLRFGVWSAQPGPLRSGESTVLVDPRPGRWTGVVGPAPSHRVFVVGGDRGVHASRSLAWRPDFVAGTTQWAEIPGQ